MIRLGRASDSKALHELQCRLDEQTDLMLLEPGERGKTDSALRRRLATQEEAGGFDLVAPDGADPSRFVGWLSVEVLPDARARHSRYVVIGVDQDASGRGVGSELMRRGLEEAGHRGLRRLELTVMTDNHRAIGLYLRHGFLVEGLRRQAVLRAGRPVDEYHMGLLLGRAAS